MDPTSGVRVDRWLWSVRLYKTRSQAAAACAAGHIQVNGQTCKPARVVRPGDVVLALTGEIRRTVKVLAPLQNRVGAKLVSHYLEDLTPASEYDKPREKALGPAGFRPRGAGRPTKRDRRKLGGFFGLEE